MAYPVGAKTNDDEEKDVAENAEEAKEGDGGSGSDIRAANEENEETMGFFVAIADSKKPPGARKQSVVCVRKKVDGGFAWLGGDFRRAGACKTGCRGGSSVSVRWVRLLCLGIADVGKTSTGSLGLISPVAGVTTALRGVPETGGRRIGEYQMPLISVSGHCAEQVFCLFFFVFLFCFCFVLKKRITSGKARKRLVAESQAERKRFASLRSSVSSLSDDTETGNEGSCGRVGSEGSEGGSIRCRRSGGDEAVSKTRASSTRR